MLLKLLLSFFSRDCAVVFTGRKIWFQPSGGGEAFSYPAVAGVFENENGGREFRLQGDEAIRMKGRTSEKMDIVPLIREGWLGNQGALESLLSKGLKKADGGRFVVYPRVLATGRFLAGETGVTLFKDILLRAGAYRAYLMEYHFACAVGIGLDMQDPSVKAVLAIEKDWFTFAAFSRFGTLCQISLPIGVDDCVREARRYLRDGKDVLFDSELLLQHLFENGFSSGSRIKAYEVLTKRISAGNATEAGFTSLEITQGVKPVLKRIAEEVKDSLNVLTPDQLDNLSREGIYLCGEAADIKGFADKLADCMGMPIHISDKSGAAAITGIGSLLEDLDTIGRVLEKALE